MTTSEQTTDHFHKYTPSTYKCTPHTFQNPFTHMRGDIELSSILQHTHSHSLSPALSLSPRNALLRPPSVCWASLHKPELCLSLSSSPLSQLGWLSVSFHSTSLMWIRVIDRLCVCACLCVYRKEETSRSPARRGPGRPRKRKSTSAPPFPTDSPKKVKWVFPFVLVSL